MRTMNSLNSIALCFSCFPLFLTLPAQAAILKITPASQTVQLGDLATADIQISDLGNKTSPALGSFDINVGFDPEILQFQNAIFGDISLGNQLDLFGFGTSSGLLSSVNQINLFEVSFDLIDDLNSLQADEFTLARLIFKTLQTGDSPLIFSDIILGDANGDPLAAVLREGEITVEDPAQIPTPSLGLFSLIFLGKICLGMRRK